MIRNDRINAKVTGLDDLPVEGPDAKQGNPWLTVLIVIALVALLGWAVLRLVGVPSPWAGIAAVGWSLAVLVIVAFNYGAHYNEEG